MGVKYLNKVILSDGEFAEQVVNLKFYGNNFYTNGALSKILFELIRWESKLSNISSDFMYV